jgi:hypothetical protein
MTRRGNRGGSHGEPGKFPHGISGLASPRLSCTNPAVRKQTPTPGHTAGDLRNLGPAHSLPASPTVQLASSPVGVHGYGAWLSHCLGLEALVA